jgi:uncharacterized protein YndB with AHSA1/START domain
MEINRNAPATADGELRIDADPQTVFSVIAAIDQWPSWNPDIKSVEVAPAGTPCGRENGVAARRRRCVLDRLRP